MTDMREMLVELCVDIYAHHELDREITLGGCGTNCSEASNVADEVVSIIGVTEADNLAERIQQRVIELGGSYD